MTKGKRWDTKKEQKLRDLVAAKKPVSVIAEVLGKTEDSVRSKMNRLGLVVEEEEAQKNSLSSSTLELPKELPTVETVLKTAAAAMKQLAVSLVKIRRKKSKKRYLGEKNVYEYEQLWVGIPAKFRETVEPFLDKELDMDVKTDDDSKVVIVLTSRENVSDIRKQPKPIKERQYFQ